MASVTGHDDQNKGVKLTYSPSPQYSDAEAGDEEEGKKTNYEPEADEGNTKKAAVEAPFGPEEREQFDPKLDENLGFHSEVGVAMPDLDLTVAPSSSTGLFIKYMLTMEPAPQKFTVDTVNMFREELLAIIQSGFHCLLGRSSKFPKSLLLIHSLFVNEGEIFGFTNHNGYGTSATDPATVVHIPSTLLLTEMSGLRKDCFSTKRAIRSTPQFPTSNDFLTDGVSSFFAKAPDPSAVTYSVTDCRAGDCILISPQFFGYLAHKRKFSSKFGYHVTVADILCQLTALKNEMADSRDTNFLALVTRLNHITAFLWGMHKKCYSTSSKFRRVNCNRGLMDCVAQLDAGFQAFCTTEEPKENEKQYQFDFASDSDSDVVLRDYPSATRETKRSSSSVALRLHKKARRSEHSPDATRTSNAYHQNSNTHHSLGAASSDSASEPPMDSVVRQFTRYLQKDIDLKIAATKKSESKDSALSNQTERNIDLSKFLLRPFTPNSTSLSVSISALELPSTFKRLVQKKALAALQIMMCEITHGWKCHFDFNLYSQFIKFDGFLPKHGHDINGFSVFMIHPSHQSLSPDLEAARSALMVESIANDTEGVKRLLSTTATNYSLPLNHSNTERMLQGGDWVLKKFSDGSPNILSAGYNLMASLVSTHGRLLEQVECTDPLIYVKILAQFERIQFIMMEGFQTQLRDRPAKEDTVHFNFDLVNDRSANI